LVNTLKVLLKLKNTHEIKSTLYNSKLIAWLDSDYGNGLEWIPKIYIQKRANAINCDAPFS